MWQLLLAAVVAGSIGFATKPFLKPKNNFSDSQTTSLNRHYDGVFTFSSSQDGPPSPPRSRKSRPTNNGVRASKVVDAEMRSEQRKGGKRSHFCFKKRKTTKAPFCSSKGNSLFDCGLGFGIMYMMSAGRAEIIKLNKAMDETAKLVQELKSELHRRKSSLSAGDVDANKVMLKKRNSKLRDNDVEILSPCVNDCAECGSSGLTVAPEPRVLQMDQLEAELEFELQKLSGCTIDSPSHEKVKPELDELEVPDEGYHETDDSNLNYSKSPGVSAFELHKKLSQVLINQQDNQIMELESELHQAQSNLHEKEAELQALKDYDETRALTDAKGTSDLGNNNMDTKSKHSVVGTKRPIDSESCSCYT
ncbi:hypothetical protein RJT34_24422 [Clitoria ternatea]|uniref:Uncharacterized protein n=1 Tax=Clitoria ternatea TaxID=43366 RepID=A0AAN9FMV1_CLITE